MLARALVIDVITVAVAAVCGAILFVSAKAAALAVVLAPLTSPLTALMVKKAAAPKNRSMSVPRQINVTKSPANFATRGNDNGDDRRNCCSIGAICFDLLNHHASNPAAATPMLPSG